MQLDDVVPDRILAPEHFGGGSVDARTSRLFQTVEVASKARSQLGAAGQLGQRKAENFSRNVLARLTAGLALREQNF